LNDNKEIVLTARLDEVTKRARRAQDRAPARRERRIRQAKEYGDLSENAEYEDAKQERRSSRTHSQTRSDDSQRAPDRRVRVRRRRVHLERSSRSRTQEQRRLRILDRRVGRSRSGQPPHLNESPLGQALMGHRRARRSTSSLRAASSSTRSSKLRTRTLERNPTRKRPRTRCRRA